MKIKIFLLIFITFPLLTMNWWGEPKEARTKARQEKTPAQNLQEIAQKIKEEVKKKLTDELLQTFYSFAKYHHTEPISKYLSIMAELLKKGADPNVMGKIYVSYHTREGSGEHHMPIATNLLGMAVYLDAFQNSNQLITLLLNAGANPNSINLPDYYAPYSRNSSLEYVTTPLALAVANSNAEIVELLLKHHAKPNISCWVFGSKDTLQFGMAYNPNKYVNTILNAAVKKGNFRIIEQLLNNGADSNLRNIKYETPLITATKGGRWRRTSDPRVVKLLLKKGANPLLTNYNGDTPLMLAAQTGSYEIVQLLIDYLKQFLPSPILTVAKEQTSYLSQLPIELQKLASAYFNPELVKSINITNQQDKTALMFATSSQNLPTIELLLKNGADPSIKNKEGKTALDIAKEKGSQEIIKLLSDAQAKQQSQGKP